MAEQDVVKGVPMGRRKFLRYAGGVWLALTAIPIVGMILRYITPPESPAGAKQSMQFQGLEPAIEKSGSQVVRFNNRPVIIIRTHAGQYKAFSAVCTNLGCVVHFQQEGIQQFYCNCHGSRYDVNGVNIAGPAPKPLAPYKVSLQDSTLVVSET